MRIAAAFLIVLITTFSAAAEQGRILEPATKPTLEQLVVKTFGSGHKEQQCRFVRVRSSLMDMFPAYLIDADGTKNVAEYKLVLYYGHVLRISKLLPSDHPSTCKLMSFVADLKTGKLDVGAYEACGDDDDLRFSDAFYFDPEKKERMGLEHKLRWDIALRRLMWRAHEIAAKC